MDGTGRNHTSRHLGWDQLHQRIDEGVPFVHRIPAPENAGEAIEIRVAEDAAEFALWIHCGAGQRHLISPLAQICVVVEQLPVGRLIKISTQARPLYQEMYGLFVTVIDKVQLDAVEPFVALEETIEAWRDLLQGRALLSEEEQLGLRGELLFLRLLTPLIKEKSLTAWVGPQKESHDFRVGNIEVEVKASRGSSHVHIINGLAQLQPSPGHRLFVYSLCLVPAGPGGGTTLADEIRLTRLALPSLLRAGYCNILKQHFGYQEEYAPDYRQRLQFATPGLLVPVDGSCPRLTKELLSSVPHRTRITDVRYRANLENLGFENGSPEFDAILAQLSGYGSP
jgi:hypothetical protein